MRDHLSCDGSLFCFRVQQDGDFEDLVLIFKFVDAVIGFCKLNDGCDADSLSSGGLGRKKGVAGPVNGPFETIFNDKDQDGAAGHGKREAYEFLGRMHTRACFHRVFQQISQNYAQVCAWKG